MYNYYFAIATKNFLMNEEPIEEILRERTMHYKTLKKELDFWFVINPNFIEYTSVENFDYNPSCSYAAIISLDQKFVQWLKLRISFIAIGSFKSESIFLIN